MSRERVLVTGGGGFLGQAIASRLHRGGHDVLAVGRHAAAGPVRFEPAVLPSPAFDDMIGAFAPSVLVHAAGPASVADSVARPADDFRGSVEVVAATLDAVRRHAPGCRVLLLSSAAVYGNPESLPVAEDAPRRPISPYGFHKRLCEDLGEEYRALFGVPVSSLRIFSAFGEGLPRQVVYDTIRRCLAGDDVELHGTGEETRDFIHADDVAGVVELLLDVAELPPVLNVASGVETTIAELAAHVRDACNPRARIHFSGRSRPGDPRRWRADVSRLRSLGFAPLHRLDEAVERVARYWMEKERTAST